jgi:hypothetical protein
MLGLPLDAWVLLFFSVGLGLSVELLFIRTRRRGQGRPPTDPTDREARP